jgi:hypothetical protein
LLLIDDGAGVAIPRTQPRTWLPSFAIEPSSAMALAVRSQICCHLEVSLASFGCPISVSCRWI